MPVRVLAASLRLCGRHTTRKAWSAMPLSVGDVAGSALFRHASKEFHLLAACCQWPRTSETEERLQRLLQPSVDWPQLLVLTQRHRVAGLVEHALSQKPIVPESVRAELRTAADEILMSNMRTAALQGKLAKRFAAASVPLIVLKGTPLCMLAYGNLRLRHSRDVDLLIAPHDIAAADALMRSEGFTRSDTGAEFTGRQQELWQRYRKHYEYVHGPTRLRFELHWRTADNPHLESFDHVLDAPDLVPVNRDIQLPALSRRELLFSLCTHGAGHAWFRLKWLADVHALLAASPPAARQELLERAKRDGTERPALQALLLCDAVFPGGSATASQPVSATVRWLVKTGRDALLQEDVTTRRGEAEFVPKNLLLSRVLLRTEARYRLEEVRLHLASPADWKMLPLPRALHFLYPLLRVPLWVKRRWLSRRKRHDEA